MRSRGVAVAAGATCVAVMLAGCVSELDKDPDGSGAVPAGVVQSFGPGDTINCDDYKSFGSLSGKTVSIYTSITSPEDIPHRTAYKPFEKCTGIKINYESAKDFEKQLPVRVKGGNAPDVAYVPQPGLIASLVRETGKVKAAPTEVTTLVDKHWDAAWKEYGSMDGKLYAAPLGANVKSFVWYSPAMFRSKGYQVPTTWDELIKLSDKIAVSGVKPWCAGFESGEATGWTGTDWLEDMMLRTTDAQTYDKWIKHQIPFNDPAVVTALDKAGSILKNDKYVNAGYGDVKTIASTSFQDAGLPILDGKCALHRQASFYGTMWGTGKKVAEDGDVWAFYLPAKDTKSQPVLGGGEFVTAFADRPEVKAFQTYLASPAFANERARVSPAGAVSANKGLYVKNLQNPLDQLSTEILQDPKAVFRFDGSDLMPSAVGSGTFWKAMTEWVTGKDSATVLASVEQSWPT